MAEMKNKSIKMYRRAYHMLYSMKRWKKREEILKEIETGTNVILINYCFKEISECICEDIDFEFAKKMLNKLVKIVLKKGLPVHGAEAAESAAEVSAWAKGSI